VNVSTPWGSKIEFYLKLGPASAGRRALRHLKRQVMGREVVDVITKGKLDFGPSEQIFYGEFDGRRRKGVPVKIIGE